MTYSEYEAELNQAELHLKSGKFDQAESIACDIIERLKDEPHPVIESIALSTLSVALWRRGRIAEGLKHAQQALTAAERAIDSPSHIQLDAQAKALSNIGTILSFQSRYTEAREYFNSALRILEGLGKTQGIARVTSYLGMLSMDLGDYTESLQHYRSALAMFEECGSRDGVANTLSNMGWVYTNLAQYQTALEYNGRSLVLFEELGIKAGAANVIANTGSLYQSLGDFSKALEYSARALALHEELGMRLETAVDASNIGLEYYGLMDYPKAHEYLSRALAVHEDLGVKTNAARDLSNLGMVYHGTGDHSKALEFMTRALKINEDLGLKTEVARALLNIGVVYFEMHDYTRCIDLVTRALSLAEELGLQATVALATSVLGRFWANPTYAGFDPEKAEEYLLKAIELNLTLGTRQNLIDCYHELSALYEHQERWQESLQQHQNFHQVLLEIQNQEAAKQASLFEQRRQAAEREKEIELARTAASAKLSATTHLLHRVLPQSIATRMIDGEEEIADYYTSVSILFADIAGFTPISSEMPAYMVVRFLNFVFKEFDRVIKKHGCEKVKTIGDGYMAVAGAPDKSEDHAERIAAAAIELQKAISLPEEIREYLPQGTKFGVRIGLHTGSVVAGVIGEERFVWDIYSDAVNIAARMESHGEPDKIHVSQEFVRHLQNRYSSTKNTSHGIGFEKRGEVDIKGKGKMQTYYLVER